MADPYIFYRPPEEQRQRQYAPNTDLEEAQVRADVQRYGITTRLLQEAQKELGKTDERLIKARLAEKKQRYTALSSANKELRARLDALSKAGAATFAAEASAAAKAYAATIKAQVDLVQAQYAFDPGDFTGFVSNIQINPNAAIEALTGSMNKLAQTGSKYMQPALINKILAELLFDDPRKLRVESDPQEIAEALAGKGASPAVIDAFLASRRMALEVWDAVHAENDAANRALADVEGVIARGITNEAEAKAEAAKLLTRFTNGLNAVEKVTDAKPDALLAAIDDDDRALNARDELQRRVDNLWAQREAFGMQDTGTGDPDGRVLADDNFRLWAADNGYDDIGYPQYDDEGNITGAAKGRQYAAALREYNWQMKRPGKWNDMLKRGAGSSTGQVVEVSYVPDDAPRVANVDGQTFLKIGDNTFVADAEGNFHQSDAPADAEWVLAARRPLDAEIGFEPIDSGNLTAMELVTPETEAEKLTVENLYAKKVVGEREAQQAGFIQRYGRDGYVAVRDPETGERTEIDGTLKPTVKVLSGGYEAAGVDSARRKSLRLAARGQIPGGGIAKAGGAPAYQFGGVTIIEGEPSTDPATERLRAKIAEQKAEPVDASVIEPIVSGRERRKKERLSQRFRPMPTGSTLPDEVVRPPDDEGVAPATAPVTPTRVEGVSYEGMADAYKRSTLYPRSPATPEPPAEEEPPFVVPPEVQTPEPDDNRRAKRAALRQRYSSRPR